MRRWMRACLIALLVALPLVVALAQGPPDGGEPPSGPVTVTPGGDAPPGSGGPPPGSGGPPGASTPAPGNQGPPGSGGDTPPDAPGAAPGTEPEGTPQVAPEATVEPEPEPVNEALELLVRVRGDLELLADVTLGSARPEGWRDTNNNDDPQLALLLRLNLEILAGQTFGAAARPEGWFGAIATTPYAIARDIRHDLELLADAVLDANQGRPNGWQGDLPIMRCSRATQALVALLEAGGVFSLDIDPTAEDFCAQVEIRAVQFTEINLLSNPNFDGSLAVSATPTYTVNSEFAIGFLDRGASRRAGLIPQETAFVPVARSYVQFSNMMLVRGPDFEVFVDYTFTTVSAEEFEALPDINTVTFTPSCTADWCD